jgi:hypothetical protein
MLLLNARRNETSDHEMAPTDRIHVLESPDPSMPLQEARQLRPKAFLHRIRNSRILLLVHGYNTPLAAVRRAYHRIAQNLHNHCPSAYDHVVGFTWPGGASPYAYPWAKARAKGAAQHLRRWLMRLKPNAEALDLFCHSLGNYLGHRALQPPTSPPVRFIFAVAPALGLHRLKQHADRQRQRSRFEHLYLFYSPDDAALGRWFPLVEWDWAAGSTMTDRVRTALRGLNVTVVKCEKTGHTGYVENPAFFSFLADVLVSPSLRSPQKTNLNSI